MYVLPAAKCSEAPSSYKTKKDILDRLAKLDKPWWDYIPARVIEVVEGVVEEDNDLDATEEVLMEVLMETV